jgi:hypothetical protein
VDADLHAFAMITEERPDALLILQDAVTMQHRNEIVDFAIQKRLPSMFQEKGALRTGQQQAPRVSFLSHHVQQPGGDGAGLRFNHSVMHDS